MTKELQAYLGSDYTQDINVRLTPTERKKGRVVRKALRGEINGPKAAKMLDLTSREIRNLKRSLKRDGDYGITHKNHYHQPANTVPSEIKDEIVRLYKKEYKNMNFSEFATILEQKGYTVSRSSIYNFLTKKRIKSPERKHKDGVQPQENE